MLERSARTTLACWHGEHQQREPYLQVTTGPAKTTATNATAREVDEIDVAMMRRCLELSEQAAARGERPFGAVVAAGDAILGSAGNCVEREGDVSRHAEVVALAQARRELAKRDGSTHTLYSIVEPCAMCSFAIRESGIQRVVYALASPVMGGASRWDVLSDRGLSQAMPQIFGKPPKIVAGVLGADAAEVWRKWNPLFWFFIKRKGCLVIPDVAAMTCPPVQGRAITRVARTLTAWCFRKHLPTAPLPIGGASAAGSSDVRPVR
jgi:tRNA(adenine34) deaminase